MHEMKPTVHALPVHLEKDANVIIDLHRSDADALNQHAHRTVHTALTAWLKYNKDNDSQQNRNLTYVDFPKHFTLEKGMSLKSVVIFYSTNVFPNLLSTFNIV